MSRILAPVLAVLVACAAIVAGGRAPSLAAGPPPIRVGAVFPVQGTMASLAQQEYRGVLIARDLVNASGGIGGRRIVLDLHNLEWPAQVNPVMASVRRSHDSLVIGGYSSALSIPASAAAAKDGLVYWEAGAVADRLTGRALPTVFRVGADGADLGSNSARFTAEQLAPRLHIAPRSLRISVVHAADAYADSVAAAAVSGARSRGMRIVSDTAYDPYNPQWPHVVAAVRAAHPDVLILASHIPDGVAFRRAFLAAHLYVKAFIGSTMAQCVPDFGRMLGNEATGVFASDRPPWGFNEDALAPAARDLYNRLDAAWARETHGQETTEEGISGFTAAWALFHTVLPAAARSGSLTTASISRAARAVNLPEGSLPNGAGLRFALSGPRMGQNLRAAAVIWQWQRYHYSVVVWPRVYAKGKIIMVPLPK